MKEKSKIHTIMSNCVREEEKEEKDEVNEDEGKDEDEEVIEEDTWVPMEGGRKRQRMVVVIKEERE